MTDAKLIQRLALVVAAQARIASKQAENDTRRFKGMPPAYDENSFQPDIEALKAIAEGLCQVPGE